MGGINHQPCRTYFDLSTKLSRAISVGRMRLEEANICLEDLILGELRSDLRGHRRAQEIVVELMGSEGGAREALNQIRELKNRMRERDYADLPTLQTLNLIATGAKFAREGLVDSRAWQRIERLMEKGGFDEALDYFAGNLLSLMRYTQILRNKVARLKPQVQQQEVSAVLEENLAGNFRADFARLYHAWNRFQEDFLASALMSTELWYALNKSGSLAGGETEEEEEEARPEA